MHFAKLIFKNAVMQPPEVSSGSGTNIFMVITLDDLVGNVAVLLNPYTY